MLQYTRLLLLIALAGGCAPANLPKNDLGEQSRLLFRDFDTAPENLPDIVMAMEVVLDKIDLEAKKKKRTFGLPPLTEEYRADVEVPKGIGNDPLRLGVAGLSHHSIDDNISAQVEEDQVCINADSVICHSREPLSEVECFLDGSCDVYRTWNTIRIESPISNFWIEAPVDFRWVELEDGRRAVVSRTWIDESFPSDKGKSDWDQRFGVDLFLPDAKQPKQTLRWYGTWLGGGVGGVNNGWVTRIIRLGLDQGIKNPDSWLDGETDCKAAKKECDWPKWAGPDN